MDEIRNRKGIISDMDGVIIGDRMDTDIIAGIESEIDTCLNFGILSIHFYCLANII